LRIELTETGEQEARRLGYDIIAAIRRILEHVPRGDLVGLQKIIINGTPSGREVSKNSMAAYFPLAGRQMAFIEIYMQNLFRHVAGSHSFAEMVSIQEFGLAMALFHEIGHHVRWSRAHGVKKKDSEEFAKAHAQVLINKYARKNAASIDRCFDVLTALAGSKKADPAIVDSMRRWWRRAHERALRDSD
jgi:hypothetical protein